MKKILLILIMVFVCGCSCEKSNFEKQIIENQQAILKELRQIRKTNTSLDYYFTGSVN